MFEDIITLVVFGTIKATHFTEFVNQITSQINPTLQTLLLSLYYFCKATPLVYPNVCKLRLWFASLILSDAYLEDNSFTCKSWSAVSGFSTKECASIKFSLLALLDYRLEVSGTKYESWIDAITLVHRSIKYLPIPVISNSFVSCV